MGSIIHSIHGANQGPNSDSGLDNAEVHIEVKDALGELSASSDITTNSDTPQCRVVESQVLISGKLKSKAHMLADFTKYGKHAGSTDCLHCVQDIGRHIQNKTVSEKASGSLPAPKDDSEVLLISDPIATILSSKNKLWLCIREVNARGLWKFIP